MAKKPTKAERISQLIINMEQAIIRECSLEAQVEVVRRELAQAQIDKSKVQHDLAKELGTMRGAK